MAAFIDNQKIDKLYFGNTPIDAVFIGAHRVFPSAAYTENLLMADYYAHGIPPPVVSPGERKHMMEQIRDYSSQVLAANAPTDVQVEATPEQQQQLNRLADALFGSAEGA